MNLKESQKMCSKKFGGKKWKGKLCNYIMISRRKEKDQAALY